MEPDYSGKTSFLYYYWLTVIGIFFLLATYAFIPKKNTFHRPPQASPNPPPLIHIYKPAHPLAFEDSTSKYLVSAFSTQGMRMVSDAQPELLLSPAGNSLVAQVLERAPSPNMALTNITVGFSLEASCTGTSALTSLNGTLTSQKGSSSHLSTPIPLLPYDTKGAFYPYPLAVVEVRNPQGMLLSSTTAVLPLSSELGCKNCHGGPWKKAGSGGISHETAVHILHTHDTRERTQLLRASAKTTIDCRSCHGRKKSVSSLSAAIHGFHAAMDLTGSEACALCHPSAKQGQTRFQRDTHAMSGIGCTQCHGSLKNHAISLLLGEKQKSSSAHATNRLQKLSPTDGHTFETIVPRQAWINLPDCTGCHDFIKRPDPGTANAFNKWTTDPDGLFSRRYENTGMLRCPSCHGSPHANYPARNPFDRDRDNLQPLQYQNLAAPLGSNNNCQICHTISMEPFIHHDLPIK